MRKAKYIIAFLITSFFTFSAHAQLFGSDRTPKTSNKSRYEVKSNVKTNNSRTPVSHDGFAPDTTENESKGIKKLTGMLKNVGNKNSQPKTSDSNNPSINRNVALAKNRRNPALDNKFIFRGFALNGIVNVESLKSDTIPPAGFKEYITDMRFYEEGEDLRLIDNSGLHVTMLFEPGTSRLTGVQVENVDRMDQVQQFALTIAALSNLHHASSHLLTAHLLEYAVGDDTDGGGGLDDDVLVDTNIQVGIGTYHGGCRTGRDILGGSHRVVEGTVAAT